MRQPDESPASAESGHDDGRTRTAAAPLTRVAIDVSPKGQPAQQPASARSPESNDASGTIEVSGLDVWYGEFRAVQGVNLTIPPRAVTAIIGPSGCGKSTFLRTLNRMHELTPDARVDGEVLLDGVNIYAPD